MLEVAREDNKESDAEHLRPSCEYIREALSDDSDLSRNDVKVRSLYCNILASNGVRLHGSLHGTGAVYHSTQVYS
jgi:hypothetical protein